MQSLRGQSVARRPQYVPPHSRLISSFFYEFIVYSTRGGLVCFDRHHRHGFVVSDCTRLSYMITKRKYAIGICCRQRAPRESARKAPHTVFLRFFATFTRLVWLCVCEMETRCSFRSRRIFPAAAVATAAIFLDVYILWASKCDGAFRSLDLKSSAGCCPDGKLICKSDHCSSAHEWATSLRCSRSHHSCGDDWAAVTVAC